MYKVVLLYLGLFFVQAEAQSSDYVPNLISSCAEQLSIDTNSTKQFLFEDDTSVNNQLYGEFLTCMWTKADVVHKNKTVNQDKLASFHVEALFSDLNANAIQKMGLWYLVRKCRFTGEVVAEEDAIKYKNCVAKLINEMSGN